MSIAGYNFYLMPDGVKLNDVLSTSPTFNPQGLASDTAYDIRATAVDAAGNEGPMSAPMDPLPSTLTYAESGDEPVTEAHAAAIDTLVAESMTAYGQPGCILDIHGPAGNYRKAYGVVSSGGRAVTVDDHWRMGSITKTFAAHAAFQQIDQGNLSLDDKLSEFVSGVPNGDIITLEHIMSMRSGIPNYTEDFLMQVQMFLFPTMAFSDDRIMSLIRGASMFAPGTSFYYSNSNAYLLGKILEAVTGRTIRDVILQDIVTPLALLETEYPTTATLTEPAMGTASVHPTWSGPAGCMTATAGDMTKWAREMRDGTLLTEESHAIWQQTFWGMDLGGTDPPTTLGYGHFNMKWGRLVGHGGSILGYDSSCLHDPETGATYIIVNNTQIGSAPAFYVTTKAISKMLYPGSMNNPVYVVPWRNVKTLHGVDSPRAFGDMRVFQHIESPGDEDGTKQLPHKVPYQI